MIKIGIQGGKGSFSEIAAKNFIEKQKIVEYEIDYLISSENVLHSIEHEKINYGIFAIENVRGGIVLESIKAFAKYRCDIIDMFQIFVSQNLLTLPNVQKHEITQIHSHVQALRQCREYLGDNFWGCQLIEADDTAESARRLRDSQLPKTAAVIANKICAEIYGLHVLQENIQDLKNNLTLFLAVKKLF